jgi:hypothetical protein
MIAKAISLLYRWLAHDVGQDIDETLDDETNDLLLAYPMPRAEREQAVLDAMAAVPEDELLWHVEEDTAAVSEACKAELARRKARAEANETRGGLTAAEPEVRARARESLRRLESGR